MQLNIIWLCVPYHFIPCTILASLPYIAGYPPANVDSLEAGAFVGQYSAGVLENLDETRPSVFARKIPRVLRAFSHATKQVIRFGLDPTQFRRNCEIVATSAFKVTTVFHDYLRLLAARRVTTPAGVETAEVDRGDIIEYKLFLVQPRPGCALRDCTVYSILLAIDSRRYSHATLFAIRYMYERIISEDK